MNSSQTRAFVSLSAGLLLALSCGQAPPPASIRLVDRFAQAKIEGAPSKAATGAQALWNFSEPGKPGEEPMLGWKAGAGISDLKVTGGKLTGKATSEFPILYVSRPSTVDANDLLDSVQIRLKVTAGTEVSGNGNRGKPDFARILENLRQSPWTVRSAMKAENGVQTLTLAVPRVVRMNWESFFIRPTNVAGAVFEIEMIQAVTQKERRASVKSGVGWQGLADVFSETIVTRSPEKVLIDVDVPANSWLDLTLGTPEEHPVTFVLEAVSGSTVKALLRRTLTTPHRWERAPVDLQGISGKQTLRLSLDVPDERRVGFWGSPAIRLRTANRSETIQTSLGKISKPQGVILIMCDTFRRDHLPMYGYPRNTSPVLAQMASKGALFLDNISQASWTKVSTPSIMTSLYPSSHGVREQADRLPASAETLAESFRDAGYATVSYSSVAFTGKLTNLQQGFEELHEASSIDDPKYRAKTARHYVDRASEWLGAHKEANFFMFLHVFDPHSPFEPRAPYHATWADPAKREEHVAMYEKARKVMENPGRQLPFQADLEKAGANLQEYMQYDKDWYDGSILGMDAEIGRLLENLKRLGLEEKVQIVLLSDHGEEFIEHGKTFHGYSVYGEMNLTPLLMYRPGVIPAGVRVSETTRNLDAMPTILELSGLPAPKKMQGQSLAPLIAAVQKSGGGSPLEAAKAGGWTPQPAVSEQLWQATAWHANDQPESFAILWEGWRLIHNARHPNGMPEYELYDHRKDPLNLKNVIAEHPDVAAKLKERLAEWRKMTDAGKLPKSDSTSGLSPQELERLKSLGYVQ